MLTLAQINFEWLLKSSSLITKKTSIAKTKQIYFPLYVLLDWFEHCQKTSQGLLIAAFSRNDVTLNPFSSSSIQPLSFRATKSAQKVSNSTSERWKEVAWSVFHPQFSNTKVQCSSCGFITSHSGNWRLPLRPSYSDDVLLGSRAI